MGVAGIQCSSAPGNQDQAQRARFPLEWRAEMLATPVWSPPGALGPRPKSCIQCRAGNPSAIGRSLRPVRHNQLQRVQGGLVTGVPDTGVAAAVRYATKGSRLLASDS